MMDKWEVHCEYDGAEEMKSDLREKIEDLRYIGSQDDFCFGFVTPGHGVKGKQRSILLDEDLAEMYQQYRGRKEIVLWVKMLTASQRKQKSGNSCRKRIPMPGSSGDSNTRNHHPQSMLKGRKATQAGSAVPTMEII